MGATREGTKELIAITDGYRESEQSWRPAAAGRPAPTGSAIDPELAIGDGGLGFWGFAAEGLSADPNESSAVVLTP